MSNQMQIVLAVIQDNFNTEVIDISNPAALVGKKVLAVWKINDGFIWSLGQKNTRPGFILSFGEEPIDEVQSLLDFLNRGFFPGALEQRWTVSLTPKFQYPRIHQDHDGYWCVNTESQDVDPGIGLEIDLS